MWDAQGTFRIAWWRGTEVAVKKLGDEVVVHEDKVWVVHELIMLAVIFFLYYHILWCLNFWRFCRRAFRDELALLQKIRHPNVVQFLGAVTQSSPMMIVTEFLPKV